MKWRKVAGEIVIAGGCPVTQSERYGWLPKVRTDMFFPKETSLDAEDITYAFDPVELSVADLEKLLNSVEGEKGSFIEREGLETLLEKIKEQIKENTRAGTSSFGEETSQSVREPSKIERNTTISAWWYYEVKYDKGGDQYVSATLFIDGATGVDLLINNSKQVKLKRRKDDSVAIIIAYIDRAFDSATDWLHLVCVDSEVGGIKNLDTLRGVAEMSYPSGVEMEELLNLIIEGEKIRARPKIKITDQVDVDALKRWDIMSDLYAPAGVEEMVFKGSSNGLNNPLQILNQNSAGLTTSSMANDQRGGELRQQAVERQQQSSMLQSVRVAEAYNHLESVLDSVVWRLLAGDVKPGTEGYRETMWVRAYLDRYGIDYKALASRKYGRFEFIRVRAKRSIGNGDLVQQINTADWLMEQIQQFQPTARPLVLHKAVVLRTQDPDLADALVKIPQAIINAQKITAENEYDTIRRRAALGQVLPLGMDDVHQDHIPIHLLDMQAHIASHEVRPWDKMDVVVFAAAAEHVGEHIKVLLGNPATNGEGVSFLKDYQNISQAGQAIAAQIQEEEGSEQAKLDPATQARLEIDMAKLQLEAQKLGMKSGELERLAQSRESRADLSRRAQMAREISEDRRISLEEERAKREAQENDTTDE